MGLKNEITRNKEISSKIDYRNFPMVPRVVFGAGSFSQLGDILLPHRRNSDAPIVFLLDDVFEGSELERRIPGIFNDLIIRINADEEPKTSQVDSLVEKIRKDFTENTFRYCWHRWRDNPRSLQGSGYYVQ